MAETHLAERYRRALELFRSGAHDRALDAFRDIVAMTEPVEESETDTEVILPFQAEPDQIEATEGRTRGGKPIRLVMDYFTAAVFQIGCVHVAQKRFEEARRFLDEAVGLWPENVNARLQLSFVLVGLGEPGSAIAHLQEAEQAQPDNVRVFRQLAWTYNEMEQFEKALAAAERAVAIDAEYVDGLEELHFALEKLGETERAAAIRARVETLTAP
jgi:tetratricopeptide (TPR) repeat protein